MTFIAGDAGVVEPKKPKAGGALSVAPKDPGADGVVEGPSGGSAGFGGKLGADGAGMGCCVVDGVGCPNMNPGAGVELGWANGDCAGGWLGAGAMG